MEKSFWTGPFNLPLGFGALNDGAILAPKVGKGKWSNFAQFSLFESKFDHLIPYVIESKLYRRVFGQDH